jgi:hypothetical protein
VTTADDTQAKPEANKALMHSYVETEFNGHQRQAADWPFWRALWAFTRGVGGLRLGQQQGTGSGRIPGQINYATVINDLLGHRTLRLLSAEEVEHPLGEECGGVRVVRRQ